MTHSGDNSPDNRTGTHFGVYELRRLLGRGTTSEIYEAFDTSKSRVIALKLLNRQAADDPEIVERFLASARSSAGLSDPHVIPVHESGTVGGVPFMDMRLIEGHTLSSELVAHGQIEPARAVHIVSQLAEALDAARAAGLIHRAITPDDVIIASTDFVYLADFGIPDSTGENIADVTALAAVLNEALTGTIFSEEVPPSAVIRSLPKYFDTVVARGMSADSARGYSSAREFAQDAARALSMPDAPEQLVPIAPRQMQPPAPPALPLEPVRFTAVPPPPPVAPATRRTVPIILGAAAVVVLLAAGGITIGLMSRSSEEAPNAVAAVTTTTTTRSTPTTVAPVAPTTSAAHATTRTTTPRASTPVTTTVATAARPGDLGLSTPMTIPDCDGTGIIVLGNATQPGSYAVEIQSYLDLFPGAQYLRTDQSCPSLRQVSDSGTAIYAVFLPSGKSRDEICADIEAASGDAYGKWLDRSTDPSSFITC